MKSPLGLCTDTDGNHDRIVQARLGPARAYPYGGMRRTPAATGVENRLRHFPGKLHETEEPPEIDSGRKAHRVQVVFEVSPTTREIDADTTGHCFSSAFSWPPRSGGSLGPTKPNRHALMFYAHEDP
jgi:hypothetical protein